MKKAFFIYLLILFGFISSNMAQTYPISSSIVMPFPHPIFLADYSDPISNSLQVNLKLIDYSTPSRNVKLIITIESDNIKLKTKINYVPLSAITLTPGTAVVLKGSDLTDALNLNNMDLTGITIGYLNQNGGRLPEGQYTFCVSAVDVNLNLQVSNESCNVAFLQMEQPPTLLTPEVGGYIKPSTPQNIRVNWQLSGGGQPSFAGMNTFQLMLFEVTTPSSNPQNAVANSQAVKIYESTFNTLTYIDIDFSTVLLVAGKQYVYRIQGMGPANKQIFDNDGYSEWGWFNYGYATGGEIILDKPFEGKQFEKTDQKVFSWGVSDKGIDGQKYAYKIIIVQEDDSTKSYAKSLLDNTPFYEEILAEVSSQDGSNFLLSKALTPDKKYIWKIEAYSDGQKVAESEPQGFFSHSLIKSFYASNREIKVIQITNPDLDNLAGKARISLSDDEEDFVDVNFSNIKINDVAGQKILTDGEILFDLSSRDDMVISPTIESNGTGVFEYVSGIIDKNGLKVKGKMRWTIPHAVLPDENQEVVTKLSTFVMDSDGKLSGQAGIEPFTTILISPKDFQLKLKETSLLQLVKNEFEIKVAGSITLPDNINTLDGQAIKVEFNDFVNQLDYIELDNLIGKVSAGVAPINNFKMEFIPLSGGVIDLSDDESPGKLASDKSWKGFYITGYKIRLHATDLDPSNQLKIESIIDHNETTDGTSNKFWISGAGLTLKSDVNLTDDEGVTFNTFPAKTIGHIEFKKNSLKESKFEGTIHIPFVGDDEEFSFEINTTIEGLEEGFLNEDLTERDLVFNPFGVENKMNVEIKRAVFENNEWISMNLKVEIPEVGSTIESIENFRVYGDNFIGVEGKNKSKTLDNFVVGHFKNLDLSITEFGAAYLGGSYALSYSAETSLSEGFAGADGPPILAISSVMETSAEPGPDATIPEPDIEVPDNLAGETAIKPAGIDLVIQTIVIDGDAKLLFTADDPVWGTKFEGGLNVKLKLPMALNFGTNITLGITPEKMDYWYFDAYFEDKSSTGIPVIEPVSLATTGTIVKLFNIVGMEGKIFRHMKGTQDENGKFSIDLAPDIMFGIGLYAQAIDNYANGFIFQADVGIAAEIKGTGFMLESMKMSMSGEVAFLNFNIRTGVSAKEVVANVAPAVAKEVVNLAAGAIFPVDFNISGTDYEINSTGFNNGSLSIGDYDGGDGYKIGANVSSKPSAEVGFAENGVKFGGSADAAGEGSFDLELGGVELAASMKKMNSVDFHLETSGLLFDFGGDIEKKKANFGFEYGQTKLLLNVNTPNKSGLIDIAIDGKKFHASTDIPNKAATIGFDIDNKKFDMSFSAPDKKASLLAEISGIDLNTSFDLEEKKGHLFLETSSEKLELIGAADMASFSLEKGSNIIALASNFSNKTGSINLTFPNNQLKGELTETQANIFLKKDDFEIGLLGKFDGTKGDLHLKEGDFEFDLGADINSKVGYISLTKGSTSISSLYQQTDSSFVRYVDGTNFGEVSGANNTYKAHYKTSDKEMLLRANYVEKSGRMLFSIPDFSFDGSFDGINKNASLEIAKGNINLKNYLVDDSLIIDYNIGNKRYRVTGTNGGSGSVFFNDQDAGISSGFGYNKQDKSGSLLFQNGDLLIDIAANKTASTGKIIVEKGDDKFHAFIADSNYLMTQISGVSFTAVQNSNKSSVFFGDNTNMIGLSKMQDGGNIFLKSGSTQIDLSKIATKYTANFISDDLSILSELSPNIVKVDFAKGDLAISTSVNSTSAFAFTYNDGSISTNVGGNVSSGTYQLGVDADGWSGNVNEDFINKSTILALSKNDVTLGINYLADTKSITLGIDDFTVAGGINQGKAFLSSTYNDISFVANQNTGVSLSMGDASASFTNISAKKFDLGLAFDDHNILIKQIPLDGKASLDVKIDNKQISTSPSDFSFSITEGDWKGAVAADFSKKSAEINLANSGDNLKMVFKDNSKYLTIGKEGNGISGGMKNNNGFFKANYDTYSVELNNNKIDLKTDVANVEFSNFHNNLCDLETKISGKTITILPSIDNGNYSLAASIDNNTMQISASDFSIGIDESGYVGTFASNRISKVNGLEISKGDYTLKSDFSSTKKVLELSYNDFTVSGGVDNSTKYFNAGYQGLKAEVSSNAIEFDFSGTTVEITNITSNNYDVEFLVGSENFIVKTVTNSSGFALEAKMNGNTINLTPSFDTLISSKSIHIEKVNSSKYNLKLSKDGLALNVDFENNKTPDLKVQKGSDSYSFAINDNSVLVGVNNYTAKYEQANEMLTIAQGSNNTFKIDDESLLAEFGSSEINITEESILVKEDIVTVNATSDQIGVNTVISGKNIDIVAKKTGELSAEIAANGLAIATNYINDEYPTVDVIKNGITAAYQFTDDEIIASTNGVEAKFNKLDNILEVTQNTTNEFKVSENLLSLKVDDIEFEATPNSFQLDKGDLSTFIDNSLVRVEQKIGSNTLKVKLENNGDNSVELATGNQSLNVNYVAGEIPEVSYIKGSDEYGYKISSESITIIAQDYSAKYTNSDNKIEIKQGENNTFSLSPDQLTASISGNNISASLDSLMFEKDDVKTTISANKFAIKVDDKLLEVKKDKSFELVLAQNQSISATDKSLELVYNSNKLKVGESSFSVEQSDLQISGSITADGAILQKGDYKLSASPTKLGFEHNSDNLSINSGKIAGKYGASEFSITADKTIGYKDDSRELAVSEQSLSMSYDGVGLAVLPNKVKVTLSNSGEIIVSKDLLKYNNDGLNVSIDQPLSAPDISYSKDDAELKLNSTLISIAVGEKKFIAGEKKFGINLDDNHRILFDNNNLDFKYAKYEASFENYSKLALSNGVQEFNISSTELNAKLDDENSIKTYLIDNKPGLTLTREGNSFDINPNGAQFIAAGYVFKMDPVNYISMQKEGVTGDDGLYVNNDGLQYIQGDAEIKISNGDKIIELLYQNNKSLSFTKSSELIFSIDNSYITTIHKDLSVSFVKGEHQITVNKPSYMASYKNTSLGAEMQFKKFSDGIGVQLVKGDYSTYIKGTKASKITVGVAAASIGGFEFTANADKDIRITGLKDGVDIIDGTLLGGTKLKNLAVKLPNGTSVFEYNSEVDVMGETVDGVEEVAMDGPAHLSNISSEAFGWATAGVKMSLIASANPRIVMNGRVKTGLNIPLLCADAPFGASIGKDGFLFKLADQNNRTQMKLICALIDVPPLEGFAKFEINPGAQTSFNVALGMRFQADFSSSFSATISPGCNIDFAATMGAGFDFLGNATLVLPISGGEGSFALDAAYVDLNAHASVIGSTGTACGNLSINTSAAMHGRLEMITTDNSTNVSGIATGSIDIGPISKSFDIDVDLDF